MRSWSKRSRRYSVTASTSRTAPSTVTVSVGSSSLYDVPVPRWSRVATTKSSRATGCAGASRPARCRPVRQPGTAARGRSQAGALAGSRWCQRTNPSALRRADATARGGSRRSATSSRSRCGTSTTTTTTDCLHNLAAWRTQPRGGARLEGPLLSILGPTVARCECNHDDSWVSRPCAHPVDSGGGPHPKSGCVPHLTRQVVKAKNDRRTAMPSSWHRPTRARPRQ